MYGQHQRSMIYQSIYQSVLSICIINLYYVFTTLSSAKLIINLNVIVVNNDDVDIRIDAGITGHFSGADQEVRKGFLLHFPGKIKVTSHKAAFVEECICKKCQF